jgi:hypothetical protein
MGFYRGPSIVRDGLVLYLDAANTKSYPGTGTTWFDKSGYGNNGTLTNGPTFSSANGGSIVFDGVNDFVSTNFTEVIDNVTIECWYRGTKITRNHLWNFGIAPTTNLICNLNDSNIPLWFYWNSNGTPYLRFTQGNFTDGNIKQLVFTHTGSDNQAYLNGQLLTAGRQAVGTQTFNNVNSSGSFNIGGSFHFGGDVFQFKIYNRALTAQEILQNYNATKSRFNL